MLDKNWTGENTQELVVKDDPILWISKCVAIVTTLLLKLDSTSLLNYTNPIQ